jgi:plastocyanin
MKSFVIRLSRSKPALFAMLITLTVVAFAGSYALSGPDKVVSQTKCDGICVALQADRAEPDTITVQPGDFVQFNSADGKSHSLSVGEGGEEHSHTGSFSSGTFGGDEAWRVQFKEEGSFLFHDHLNPKINVLVVVYTPGKEYKVQ